MPRGRPRWGGQKSPFSPPFSKGETGRGNISRDKQRMTLGRYGWEKMTGDWGRGWVKSPAAGAVPGRGSNHGCT